MNLTLPCNEFNVPLMCGTYKTTLELVRYMKYNGEVEHMIDTIYYPLFEYFGEINGKLSNQILG